MLNLTLNYPKPKTQNNGFNVFVGHPNVILTDDQAMQLNNPQNYGWVNITYSDGEKALMWLDRVLNRTATYKVS